MNLVTPLLDYTRKHLTSERSAEYIMTTLGFTEREWSHPGFKVLFLPCDGALTDRYPNFLTASVFHGFHKILGDRVLDVPIYDYVYKFRSNITLAEQYEYRKQMWGQGYTLGFKLPRRDHLDRSNIEERIQRREWDMIVFGKMSVYEERFSVRMRENVQISVQSGCSEYENDTFRFLCSRYKECNWVSGYGADDNRKLMPKYMHYVRQSYPNHRVALLFGDDSGMQDGMMRNYMRRYAHVDHGPGRVFMRELLPFVSSDRDAYHGNSRPWDAPFCYNHYFTFFFNHWNQMRCALFSSCGEEDFELLKGIFCVVKNTKICFPNILDFVNLKVLFNFQTYHWQMTSLWCGKRARRGTF